MIAQEATALRFCKKGSLLYLFILLVVISGTYILYSIITGKDTGNDKRGADESRAKGNNLAFVLQLKLHGGKSFLMNRFKNCIASICEHSTVLLTFHIIADEDGKRAAKGAFDEVRKTCEKRLIPKYVYYDVDEIVERVERQITEIKEAIQNDEGKRTRPPLFFFPIVMDRILPNDVDRVILFDADFFFQSDIKQLFDHFDNFTTTNIFGLAKVQQPTYRREFLQYRTHHPQTKIGDPPPDGVTGYNGGLIMINLNHMRNSKLYKQLLRDNAIKTYADKYEFKGHRAEQDFFILLDIEHHDLFYVVPCSWNRQVLIYMAGKTSPGLYDLYHNCPEAIHAYHGAGGAKMANEELSLDFVDYSERPLGL